jgi:hypothetical protein
MVTVGAEPCWALFGERDEIAAGPAVTLKTLPAVRTVVPVVVVMVRSPSGAATRSMVMLAVRELELLKGNVVNGDTAAEESDRS